MCYVWKYNCSYCLSILKMLLYSVFVYAVRESGEESCVSAQVVELVFSMQVVVVVWFNILHIEVQVQLLCCYVKAFVEYFGCLCRA